MRGSMCCMLKGTVAALWLCSRQRRYLGKCVWEHVGAFWGASVMGLVCWASSNIWLKISKSIHQKQEVQNTLWFPAAFLTPVFFSINLWFLGGCIKSYRVRSVFCVYFFLFGEKILVTMISEERMTFEPKDLKARSHLKSICISFF